MARYGRAPSETQHNLALSDERWEAHMPDRLAYSRKEMDYVSVRGIRKRENELNGYECRVQRMSECVYGFNLYDDD